MHQLRSTKVVTRILLCLTVFKVSLVVSREGTNSQENNYTQVSCDFENNLCGWRNLNPGATWTKKDGCKKRNFWGTCTTTLHYRRLKMNNNLGVNTTGTLVGPSLFARTDVRCHLSFFYYYNCESDACQLSVERQTHFGVDLLWNVTTYSGTVNTAHFDVPCSDTEYQILIVGKKLKRGGSRYLLDVDNIVFNLFTLPTTTEGSAISSLSRRVSPTTLTSLEVTSTPSLTSNVPMPNPDKQSSDDDGLGTGPVVAIVIVIVVVVVVVVVIAVIVVRRRNGAVKHNRAPGPAGSTSPGDSNVGGVEGHDNVVYSANQLAMDTIPPMSGNTANADTTPDYYNVSGQNCTETGSSAPAQDDLYENTRSPPPAEEYAVVDKKGQKKLGLRHDEYALPNKDQQKKKKREKQAGQGQQTNDIPTENKKKKGRKTDHQANQSALNGNAAGRSTQAEEAAAAGTSDYEPVAGDSGMATSRPEQPSDMYNKLGDKGRAGMQLETPQTHYDHLSAPDDDYSGMDLEDKIRDQQREAVADQYSHI